MLLVVLAPPESTAMAAEPRRAFEMHAGSPMIPKAKARRTSAS